jgi:hypothetical protein
MKYKKLNINFDNWVDIPISTNEQQIKDLHPIFYKFLIEKKLMSIYLNLFDKCHWKQKGNTFEEIMNSHKNLPLSLIISYTLEFKCVKEHNLYYDISSLNDEFESYYYEKK